MKLPQLHSSTQSFSPKRPLRSFVYAENTMRQPTHPRSSKDIPSELAEGQMGTENSLFTRTLQTRHLCGDLI